MKTREEALALDAADPLAPLREQFAIPPGLIYLDGNSLGVMPKATPARVQQVVTQEWGVGLIGSWNSAGWMELAPRIGDKIARLIGAQPGECVAADSTSVNLFKVLNAALNIARADDPKRTRIVSERSNFPTDLYIAEATAAERGCELVLADSPEAIPALLDERCAVLMLTHVNYPNGRMHDMAALSQAAHDAGALALWDLAHSAGAVPVDLTRQRRRLRHRLRLQVPERRARRAGLRLGGAAACRALLAAAGRLDGPCGALRVHARLPARARHPPLPVRHAGADLAGRAGMWRRHRARRRVRTAA